MPNWIHYRDLILGKSGVWKNFLNSKCVYYFENHMRIRFYYKKNIINETFSSYCSVPSGQCKNMSMGHEIAGIKKSNFYALKGECIIHYQILIGQKGWKNIISLNRKFFFHPIDDFLSSNFFLFLFRFFDLLDLNLFCLTVRLER